MKKVDDAVSAGNIEQAEEEYRQAARRLDRAGARNIIHPNTAARRKSRLQRLLKKAKVAVR
jgi:small subunit ribosomal protein S20